MEGTGTCRTHHPIGVVFVQDPHAESQAPGLDTTRPTLWGGRPSCLAALGRTEFFCPLHAKCCIRYNEKKM